MKNILMRFLFAVVIALSLSAVALSGESSQEKLRNFITDLATTGHNDVKDKPKEKQLLDYAERIGTSKAEVEETLLRYARGEDLPGEYGARVSEFSLWLLGRYRCKEALSIYRERLAAVDAAQTPDVLRRRSYLIGIARIDAPESLDVAHAVVHNKNRYDQIDRFAVYDELGQLFVLRGNQVRDGNAGTGLREFLLTAAEKETSVDNVVAIDKFLSTGDADYRWSERRKRILGKHNDTKVSVNRSYIEDQLEEIQKHRTRGISNDKQP